MQGSLTSGFSAPRLKLSGSQALALGTIVTNLVRVVSTMCLTRLLTPDVYGITGMIMSIFYMINMVTDIGLQAYVVRHERSDEAHFLDSVYSIHAIRGLILCAVSILLAWPLSILLEKPQLTAPLMVASLFFVIEGQISLHQFRGLRDGKVQRYAMIGVLMSVSQTIAAIILAFIFRNVWAIVTSMLVASTVRVWASYALFGGRRHAFRRDREVAMDLWRFSRVIAASSVLTLVLSQVDKLALGRILSLAQFGIYVIAATLAAAPTAFAFNYASNIVYPALAVASREGTPISDAYYRCWGRFFYLYAFGGGALIGVAKLLVRLLYDHRYWPSAGYLSILAVSTTLTLVTRSMESIEVARGRPHFAVQLNITRLIWLTSGGLLAIWRSDPLTFVLTIGLLEVPAYCYACWHLAREKLIRWPRELSLGLTIIAGAAVGEAVSGAANILSTFF